MTSAKTLFPNILRFCVDMDLGGGGTLFNPLQGLYKAKSYFSPQIRNQEVEGPYCCGTAPQDVQAVPCDSPGLCTLAAQPWPHVHSQGQKDVGGGVSTACDPFHQERKVSKKPSHRTSPSITLTTKGSKTTPNCKGG